MKARNAGRGGLFVGVAVALAALLVPVAVQAETPGGEGAFDPPPGITVAGLGFARVGLAHASGDEAAARAASAANRTAVKRAVGDARRRAKAIARVLGVEAGAPTEVSLRSIDRFGNCDGPAKGQPRCAISPAAVTVTFAIVGGSDGTAAPGAVDASGRASVDVRPSNPQRSPSIKRAVLGARMQATTEAVDVARRNAMTAARSAGLGLGSLVSVSEPLLPFLFGFGLPFSDPALGSYGAGRFCGYSSRPVIRRNPETGKPRLVRSKRIRRCRVPARYGAAFQLSYEAR